MRKPNVNVLVSSVTRDDGFTARLYAVEAVHSDPFDPPFALWATEPGGEAGGPLVITEQLYGDGSAEIGTQSLRPAEIDIRVVQFLLTQYRVEELRLEG